MIARNKAQFGKAPTYERLLIGGSVGFALVVVAGGYYLARMTYNPHWMNRAGAAIVAIQGIVICVDFLRRDRLRKILDKKPLGRGRERATELRSDEFDEARSRIFLENEIRRAEIHVLIIAVLIAMTGEILHGFGDLLFEVLIG